MLTEPGSDGATSSPTETKRRLPRAPLHFRRNGGRRNGSGTPPGTRRNTVLVIGLVVVIVAGAVGWVAGRRIQTPADRARMSPPNASLITVPVEKRTLTSDVVVPGNGALWLAADGDTAGVDDQAGEQDRVDRAMKGPSSTRAASP